jgi:hypothetical protein
LSKIGPWSILHRTDGRPPHTLRRTARATPIAGRDMADRSAKRSAGVSAFRIGEFTSW